MEEQNPPQAISEESPSDFASYPFPKNLKVAVKLGCYRVYNNDASEYEDINATSAKDALAKTKMEKVSKILYLGFIDKSILTQGEIINEEIKETTAAEEK